MPLKRDLHENRRECLLAPEIELEDDIKINTDEFVVKMFCLAALDGLALRISLGERLPRGRVARRPQKVKENRSDSGQNYD